MTELIVTLLISTLLFLMGARLPEELELELLLEALDDNLRSLVPYYMYMYITYMYITYIYVHIISACTRLIKLVS